MSKKVRIIRGTISLILGVTMIICFIVLGNKNYDKDETSSQNLADTYSNLTKDNSFKVVTSTQVINLLKNGTGIVFLGFSSCPWCQAYAPILNSVAKDHNYANIYYYDIKEIRANNTSEYLAIVKLLKNYLSSDDGGNPRVFVPNVTFVKDGKIVANDNETSMINGDDTSSYWSNINITALKNKLNNYFSLIDIACESCNG